MTATKHSAVSRACIALAGAGVLALLAGELRADEEVTVIELTQTGCQFVEAEGGDRGFTPTSKADCEAINAESGAERLAVAEPLRLAPGKYVFRVTNESVPYMVGFYLRAESLIDRAFLPSVSGGGLHEGVTLDYEVELKPGHYVYSCPLNPTPDYALIVE